MLSVLFAFLFLLNLAGVIGINACEALRRRRLTPEERAREDEQADWDNWTW
jgi:hypothetical protein